MIPVCDAQMVCSGTVLIVDDEAAFREPTLRLLGSEGFRCQAACSGDEALEILRASRFDAMVADVRMPGNPELRVVQAGRELDTQMAIILVTGYPTMETAIRCIQFSSVVAYLVKPFDFEELLAHLKLAVAHSQYRRAVSALSKRLRTCHDDLEALGERPMPRAGEDDEPIAAGTIRTLAACLSELLTLGAQGDDHWCRRDLCELLDCPKRPLHREAIAETIEVLKKTKDSFKSKALAELRAKLESLLG